MELLSSSIVRSLNGKIVVHFPVRWRYYRITKEKESRILWYLAENKLEIKFEHQQIAIEWEFLDFNEMISRKITNGEFAVFPSNYSILPKTDNE